MDKIPTAESFNFKYRYKIGKRLSGTLHREEEFEMMIEFAKLHVEAALKKASENAQINVIPTDEEQWENIPEVITSDDIIDNEGIMLEIDEKSILNAYPLDNIK